MVPLVLNPLMAKLAEAAGFRAGYLGGGAMGYANCATEANLTLTQMVQAGLEIRSQCELPIILDAACGWGDPMHTRNTMRVAEAAGFAAIEIEDQILPKRAHHHVGREHIVVAELMVAKIEEAVRARRNPDLVIIARTNAARTKSLDEALRRGEAFHRAGADVLLVMPRTPDDLPTIGRSLPGPLMHFLSGAGLKGGGITFSDLVKMGFSLLVDAQNPLFAMIHALRSSFAALTGAEGPSLPEFDPYEEERLIHEAIGLPAMLEIERRTVER